MWPHWPPFPAAAHPHSPLIKNFSISCTFWKHFARSHVSISLWRIGAHVYEASWFRPSFILYLDLLRYWRMMLKLLGPFYINLILICDVKFVLNTHSLPGNILAQSSWASSVPNPLMHSPPHILGSVVFSRLTWNFYVKICHYIF